MNPDPYVHEMAYFFLLGFFELPGAMTIIAIACSRAEHAARCGFSQTLVSVIGWLAAFFYLVVPPLIVLVCMIIQIKYLRKRRQETEVSPLLPNTNRHVSITVLMVSLLFFVCSTAYFMTLIYWVVSFRTRHAEELPDQNYINIGIIQGISEFTLPLIYAALYPVILVCRKPQLKERYRRGFRKILPCCFRSTTSTRCYIVTAPRDVTKTPRDVTKTPRDFTKTPLDDTESLNNSA
jgi:hypothetical protein